MASCLAFQPACAQEGNKQELLSASAELSETTFASPHSSSGIRCWWWWLNGNVTKESITRDLEEMKKQGFSGACIFDAGGADQRGNEQVPEGPMFGSPEWQELYRHAVQEAHRLGLVLSLSIQSGWNLGGPDVSPQESAKHITWSETVVEGERRYEHELPVPPHRDGFYRDFAVVAFPYRNAAGIEPVSHLRAKAAFEEAAFSATDTRYLLEDKIPEDGKRHAEAGEVIDLTPYMDSTGLLSWEAPEGKWVVMRFGYTNNGAHVSTSSGQWQGLVLDYMSREHFTRYWDTHVRPLLESIDTLAGTTVRYLQTDSWELGGINWTENFREEFRTRRKYDLLPYLPVVAGKIIQSREVSNRFLADFRKTIGGCISDNHYGVFAEKAAEYGMGIQPESAGPHAGPLDGLKNYGHSELMMSEFWSPSGHRPTPEMRFFVKQASSAAHIYGKRLIGAEGFTTIGRHWNDVIWEHMKPSFDHEVCAGLNLTFLHTFTSSPAEMGIPGQEYFAGTHFNPNITWWKYSGAFFEYMARIQYMMQHGRFVADVLYYYGDHVPNIATLKASDPAGALPEYDYDVINEDRLLDLQVKDGRITLPHGMSYTVLVLPGHAVLSREALKKVAGLVRDGAVVIGPKTLKAASLTGYPASEEEVQRLARELWGNAASGKGSRKMGKGTVAWGYTAREWLLEQGIPADCRLKTRDTSLVFDYIHHRWGDADVYFISSQQKQPVAAEAVFRVSGKLPELWNAVSGEIRPAQAYSQDNGLTRVPLEFTPYGSWFLVFREAIPADQQGEAAVNFGAFEPVDTLKGAWQVSFDPAWGGPDSVEFPELVSWTDRPEDGIRYYSGSAVYRKTFPGRSDLPEEPLYLDLGEVQDVGIARVALNGKDLGVVWAPPYRVALTGLLREKENLLEVEVINSWRNRLVGDRDLPGGQRYTKTNIVARDDWQLLPSGLLGPVIIGAMHQVP